MPPATTTTGNRIGLGVGLETFGGTDPLTYVNSLNSAIERLIANARAVPGTMHIQVPGSPPAATQDRVPRAAQQARQTAQAEAQREVDDRRRQLSLLDVIESQHAVATKRRATDVANHTIAEGRRASDATAFFAKQSSQELTRLYAAHKTVGSPHAETITREIEHRMRTEGAALYGPGGKRDPNSPENRRFLEEAAEAQKRRVPNMSFRDKEAARMAAEQQLAQQPTLPHAAAVRQPLPTLEQEAQLAVGEIERAKDVARHLRSQRRRANVEEFESSLRATDPSTLARREEARAQSEIESAAQEKIRKAEMNRRINDRAETITRQRAEANARQRAEAEAQAVQRAEAERASIARTSERVSVREQQRQARLDAEARRQGITPPSATTRLVRDRVEEGQERAAQIQRRQEQEAERERRRADEEARRVRDEARATRQRAEAEQREQIRAQREVVNRQRDKENLARARQAELESAQFAENQRNAREGLRALARLPIQGPQLDPLDAAQRAEGLGLAQTGLKARAQNLFPTYGPGREQFLDTDATTKSLDQITNAATTAQNRLNQVRFKPNVGQQFRQEAEVISTSLSGLTQRAETLRAELARPAGMRRTRELVEADLNAIQREMTETAAATRRLQLSISQQARATTPTLDPSAVSGRSGPFGTLDMVGRITRNILLYEAVSRATFGLQEYTTEAVQAAIASNDLSRAFEFQANQAHTSSESLGGLIDEMRSLGQARREARAATTEALRFAEERPELADDLQRTVTNISAARGLGVQNTDQLIEQLRRRESKFYKRIFGVTVEDIYEQEAQRRTAGTGVDNSSFVGEESGLRRSGLFVGPKADFKAFSRTDEQRAKDFVQNMTEAQKEGAVLNYILSQQDRFAGEAARRQSELAGSLDRVRAQWVDNKEAVGEFIITLRPIQDFLDGVLARLKSFNESWEDFRGRVSGTGAGGAITDLDITRSAQRRQQSGLTRASEAISDYGLPVLGGLALTAVAGGIGRRPARVAAAQRAFDASLQESVAAGFETATAATRANAAAGQARAGIVRSVTTGYSRVTSGLTTQLLGMFETAAASVNQQGAAARASYLAGSLAGTRRYTGTTFTDVGRRAGQFEGQQVVGPFTALREIPQEQIDRRARFQETGQVAGGLIGGVVGAEIGSMVAQRLEVGPITAAALTITGAIAGTAIGTAAGNAGAGLAGGLASRVGLGALGVYGLAAAVAGAGAYALTDPSLELDALRRRELESPLFAQQMAQRNQAREEGRLLFYDTRQGATTDALTEAQVQQLIKDNRATPQDFRERIFARNELSEADPETRALLSLTDPNSDFNKKLSQQRNEFWARVDNEERQKAQEILNRQAAGLAKLRESIAGSFKLVADVASVRAGGDNPFVQIFADGATAADRMRLQWGHLGDEMVEFFTKLEQRKVALAETQARFESLGRAQDNLNRRFREGLDRQSPGAVSSREEALIAAQREMINAAKEIPALWAKAAEVMGVPVNQLRVVERQLAQLTARTGVMPTGTPEPEYGVEVIGPGGQRFTMPALNTQFAGLSAGPRQATFIGPDGQPVTQYLDAGTVDQYAQFEASQARFQNLSPEAQRRMRTQYNQGVLDIVGALDPKQIRANPMLREAYVGAIQGQANEAETRIQGELRRAEIQARITDNISQRAKEFGGLRDRLIAEGKPPDEVRKQYDRAVLALTEGTAPKDLPDDIFAIRQRAFEQEAERFLAQPDAARDAVQQGLDIQTELKGVVEDIRDALLSGDLSILIQIENDAQARTDAENLKDMGQGLEPRGGFPRRTSQPPARSMKKYK